jgi:PilZ domain
MTERRIAERRKTYKGAQVTCGAGPPIIGCIVRNLSQTGACLAMDSFVCIPGGLFNLVLESDSSSRACRLVWRDERRMGVQFL